MQRYDSDAILMANAIEVLSVTNPDGTVNLGGLTMYSNALGCTEDEADELMDKGIEVLVSEGVFTDLGGTLYNTKKLEEEEREEARETEEWEAYKTCREMEYRRLAWE